MYFIVIEVNPMFVREIGCCQLGVYTPLVGVCQVPLMGISFKQTNINKSNNPLPPSVPQLHRGLVDLGIGEVHFRMLLHKPASKIKSYFEVKI